MKKRRIIILVIAIAVLALIGAGTAVMLSISSVPEVVGLSSDEARELIGEKHLSADIAEEHHDTVPKGVVISQGTEAGEIVKRDSSVSIAVSLGIEQREVPDVLGKTQKEAEDALTALEFKVSVTEEFSDTVEKGKVITQSIKGGESVDKRSAVALVVSKGPDVVEVPDTVGKKESDAVALLEKSDFKAEKSEEHHDTVEKGIVISQSADAGELLKRGSVVSIAVSLGIEQREVPDVLGKTQKEAEDALTALEFKVSVTEEFSDTVEKGKIITQSIKGGESVDKWSAVTLVVSKGPDVVEVPNVWGKSLDEAKSLIKAADLKIKHGIKCTDTAAEGKIFYQSEAGGTYIKRGSEVEVYVSAGIANTVGNSNSNAKRLGSVTGQGNWVYFVNTKNRIYKMKHDGSEKQLVTTDSAIYINVVGEWIYYANVKDGYKLYKIKLDGTEKTKISDTACFDLIVVGDTVYFRKEFKASAICKMKTDGSGKVILSNDACMDMSVEDGYIYYINRDDSAAYKIAADGSEKMKLHEDFVGSNLSVVNGKAYCEADLHVDIEYITINTDGTGFTDHPAVGNRQMMYMNVSGDRIYYIRYDYDKDGKSYIAKMKLDGTDEQLLKEVSLSSVNSYINVVGDWIYFPNAADGNAVYRVKNDGSAMEKCA